MEDGSNGCRRCEKVAVAEADGTISFTFAIGDVEGATSEAGCEVSKSKYSVDKLRNYRCRKMRRVVNSSSTVVSTVRAHVKTVLQRPRRWDVSA